jgi:hypothetical protein
MIFYALSVALILAGCFAFYKIFLQQETFFPLNRFVLLTCLALSFSLPLVPVPEQWSFRKAAAEPIDINWLKQATVAAPRKTPTAAVTTKVQSAPVESVSFYKSLSPVKILLWIYWLGVAVFGINFLVQLFILLYRVYSNPFIQDGRFRIVEVTGEQAPCSFANNIFINPEKYDWDTYSQIILHEKIHIQQGHSYDIIFAELALIFQWFNPFAWLYRKAMEDNLEFLTDNELLQHSNVEPQSYQLSLVKVSAPNFPASLTTNYNQSVLKKRLMMMNSKKSNINSTWKYVCIVPLMLVFIALLNEPVALGKGRKDKSIAAKQVTMPSKGTWFATIKKEKINIRFEDEDRKGNNSTDFDLSEFKALPRNTSGIFKLIREAGTVTFTGKFEGNIGMGNYEFKADDNFLAFLEKEGIHADREEEGMTYFMVDLKKDYITMLKAQGFTNLSKNDVIPLAALKVTSSYITALKNAGIDELTLQDLVPLKALGVDADYIADIKKSGTKNLTADRLVSLKAQGIDGDFIKNAKAASGNDKVETIIAEKIDNKVTSHRTDHKTNGTADEDVAFGMLIAKKALDITSEYAKAFSNTKLNVKDDQLVAFKALGITADYIKSFELLGLKDLSAESFCGMKALGLTATEYAAYQKLGFTNLSADEVISAKATGTTPTFISAMKKKGHNFTALDKYVSMKVVAAGGD